MDKRDLIGAVADATGLTRAAVAAAIESTMDEIVRSVASGGTVRLSGFGTFESTVRAPRVGRNPRTGDPVAVPAAVVPRFRVSRAFRRRVAEGS